MKEGKDKMLKKNALKLCAKEKAQKSPQDAYDYVVDFFSDESQFNAIKMLGPRPE
jgi:hypothetical protein